MKNLKKLLIIFKNHEYDNSSTENKILTEIDNILKKGPIDNIRTKDDFIRFIFKVYFYRLKYRPFLSYIEILFRYYLIILFIGLLGISFLGGLFFNETSTFKFEDLWGMLSNLMYFSILIYILIRIYTYIRKLLRHEIKSTFIYVFGFGIIKFALFTLLVTLTWFIGQLLAILINIIYISITELGKILM